MSAHNSVSSDQSPGEDRGVRSALAVLNLTSVYIGVTSCLPPRKWNIRSIQLTINVIKHQGGVRCPAWLYVTVACETYYYLSNSSYFNIQKIDRNFLIRLGYALLDDG